MADSWRFVPASEADFEPLLALHERDRANGLLDAPWPHPTSATLAPRASFSHTPVSAGNHSFTK